MNRQVYKRLLNIDEVAKVLGISAGTIRNKLHNPSKFGEFPIQTLRIGKSIRFDIEDVHKFIESQKVNKDGSKFKRK